MGALEPGRMYEAMDPRGIYFHQFRMDPNYYFGQNQAIQTWAEKVANISDITLGRAPSTPNAPRTARGQIAMIQMAQISMAILTAIHAMSFKEVFRRVHNFKKRWAKSSEGYRVLNKQTGLFQNRTITDRAFQYDADFEFQLTPNRTQEQQVNQALFGMTISAVQQAVTTPFMADTIRTLLGEVYLSLGKKNFEQIWPADKIKNIAAQASMNAALQQQQKQPQPGMSTPGPESPAPTVGPENTNLNMQMGPLA
jgi:hypothetical protein